MKDVQTAGEAFSPPKRTSSISKHEIVSLFYIFVGHFCPPGSGPTKISADPDPDLQQFCVGTRAFLEIEEQYHCTVDSSR
jgi:hypothetical protein